MVKSACPSKTPEDLRLFLLAARLQRVAGLGGGDSTHLFGPLVISGVLETPSSPLSYPHPPPPRIPHFLQNGSTEELSLFFLISLNFV